MADENTGAESEASRVVNPDHYELARHLWAAEAALEHAQGHMKAFHAGLTKLLEASPHALPVPLDGDVVPMSGGK